MKDKYSFWLGNEVPCVADYVSTRVFEGCRPINITTKASALDVQVSGNHYKNFTIQPIEFAMKNELDTCQHAVVKYVCRHKDKGGIEDLRKARHYLELLAEFEYGETL